MQHVQVALQLCADVLLITAKGSSWKKAPQCDTGATLLQWICMRPSIIFDVAAKGGQTRLLCAMQPEMLSS